VDGSGSPEEVILNVFRQVFVTEKTLSEEDLPYRVMLVETFPLNVNGKLDLFQLNRGMISGDAYDVVEIREDGKLKDFELKRCEEGPADMIEMVFDDIKEDLKNKMPTSKLMKKIKNNKNKKENPTMENNNKPFNAFDPMCYMQQQMMNNMNGMMGQKFPMFNQYANYFQSPEMQSMMEMMPNMESMMPEMQKMAQTMYGMRPNIPLMLNNIAQAVLPILHQQTVQMFANRNEINQMTFDMIQRLCEQKSEIDEKWYELALSMVSGPIAKEDEAEEAEETEAEEAEVETEAEAEAEETETEE
jgi:hypothetical protein